MSFKAQIRVTHTDEPVGGTDGEFPDARAAWRALHGLRKAQEDAHESWGVGEYSSTLRVLDYCATEAEFGNPHEDWPLGADGTGQVWATTPGLGEGEWDEGVDDPGLTYAVLRA